MATQNHSTIAASLQAAQDAFQDITDLLLGADALIAQHPDSDGNALAAARNLLRQVRHAAITAGHGADYSLIAG